MTRRSCSGCAEISRTLATVESRHPLSAQVVHSHMESHCTLLAAEIGDAAVVFIFAGLGGATGTGAAAAVARAGVELGREVHAVVTMPFDAEDIPVHVHDHAAVAASRGCSALSMDELLGLANAGALAYCGAHIAALPA